MHSFDIFQEIKIQNQEIFLRELFVFGPNTFLSSTFDIMHLLRLLFLTLTIQTTLSQCRRFE